MLPLAKKHLLFIVFFPVPKALNVIYVQDSDFFCIKNYWDMQQMFAPYPLPPFTLLSTFLLKALLLFSPIADIDLPEP